jgi:hypothetical protein
MANEEQLAVFRQGVGAWNAWRAHNPGVRPDLSGAQLPCADLREAFLAESNLAEANLSWAVLVDADLTRANLPNADLVGADLTDANLTEAILCDARLIGADLSETVLIHADLTDATLTDANLTSADLESADLRRVNLTGANLTQVEFGDTVLADLDLSVAKGLEATIHWGPSIIDYRTLQKSGQLPLSFLRGCGLPNNLIEYLPSLLNQPIQFYSCFISYSSKEEEFARRLHADLQDKGIRCWFAPENMKIGDRIRTKIDEVIRLHEKLLLVLSANSINSDWVEKEVETAFEKERETESTVLFPVRLDDAVLESKAGWAADIKRARHIGDFRRWKDHDGYRRAFERLLHDLKVVSAT